MSGLAVASHLFCAIVFTLATFVLSLHRATRSTVLISAGVYLFLITGVGYFIWQISGRLDGFLKTMYCTGTLLILLLIFFSGRLRAKLKLVVSKNLLKLRYDYREEWMRFSMLLFENDDYRHISTRVIKALADVVESPKGILFEWEEKRGFVLKDCWNSTFPNKDIVIERCPFTDYLEQAQRALELPSRFGDNNCSFAFMTIPEAMRQFSWAWLLVPLLHGNRLHAFVLLAHPEIAFFNVNWEVLDLLYMAGRQAVICLVQEQNMQALSIARQFEGYNRLSAFVMHDLKNVYTQLNLIQNNKKKHENNPAFIKSVYGTIDHLAEKIDRLLLQMCGRQQCIKPQGLKVSCALKKVIELTDHRQPIPYLEWQLPTSEVLIMGDEDRFINIICHLVENAQQATPENGEVVLCVAQKEGYLIISIQDSGCGMDPEFLQHGLYKPFVTTKGDKGTGIGVYEALSYVQAVGGRLAAETVKGKGSIFRLEFPLVGLISQQSVA